MDNFNRALWQLGNAVELIKLRELSQLEEQGTIQVFEYTHELAWNLLKDYLEEYGVYTGLIGSRDTTREAFKRGLITRGEVWMDMIKSRNLSSHTYNEETANKLMAITPEYYQAFIDLQINMNNKRNEVK